MISNAQFLQAIFGEQYIYAHVTSFPDDPGNIPHDRKGICWAGGYYKDTSLIPFSNQFYTVSLFASDETNRSKRRKANFAAQHVIMLDDVKEKLPLSQVQKLPLPSIVLQSSLHSEQWLYILATPCTERDRLDNLTDQLITNGLAPNTKDPGMKGVTRYGRLPEGVNTKASRIAENGGIAPSCKITEWHPERRYTLEQLAAPFNVNLDAVRREVRIDGAVEIPDHPILQKLKVKSMLSPGRYDITCPWVEEHTGQDDSGTAVFTNEDGSAGFQCHHGSHESKTIKDLLNQINEDHPGFKTEYQQWRAKLQLGDKINGTALKLSEQNFNFLQSEEQLDQTFDFLQPEQITEQQPEQTTSDLVGGNKTFQEIHEYIVRMPKNHPDRNAAIGYFLRLLDMDDVSESDRIHYHKQLYEFMEWTAKQFAKILGEHRTEWYGSTNGVPDRQWLLENIVLISEGMGGFYNLNRGVYQTPSSLNALYMDMQLDGEAPAVCIANSRHKKVADGLGWHPVDTQLFEMDGQSYVNIYRKTDLIPVKCDVSEWLELCHFIYGEYTDLVLDHMAFTLQHPEVKIRWQILTWGLARTGKTMTIQPLLKIMGKSGSSISNEQFESGYDDIYAGMKVLAFEEVWQNDTRRFNRLKTKLANDGLEKLNIKGKTMIAQHNLYSMYMYSNHGDALQFSDSDRKLLVIKSPDRFIKEHGSNTWYTNLGKKINNDLDYLAGCYWFLLNRDVSKFEHSVLPKATDAMYEMVRNSRPEFEQVVMEMIEHKEGFFQYDVFKLEDLMDYLKGRGYRFARKNLTKLLKLEGFSNFKASWSVEGVKKQVRFWGPQGVCEDKSPKDLYEYLLTIPIENRLFAG